MSPPHLGGSAPFGRGGLNVKLWVPIAIPGCSRCWRRHLVYHWRADFGSSYMAWPNSVMFLGWFPQQKAKEASNFPPKHTDCSFFPSFSNCTQTINNPPTFTSLPLTRFTQLTYKNEESGPSAWGAAIPSTFGSPKEHSLRSMSRVLLPFALLAWVPGSSPPADGSSAYSGTKRSHGQILRKLNKLENNLWKGLGGFCWLDWASLCFLGSWGSPYHGYRTHSCYRVCERLASYPRTLQEPFPHPSPPTRLHLALVKMLREDQTASTFQTPTTGPSSGCVPLRDLIALPGHW